MHGWFVLPISLYLIWTVREEVRKLTPWADARALAPLALAGFGWLAARLGGVLVAEQYFAVAAIPLLVWALLGPEISKRILFPLGYLLLAVPVGEALIPHMIWFRGMRLWTVMLDAIIYALVTAGAFGWLWPAAEAAM